MLNLTKYPNSESSIYAFVEKGKLFFSEKECAVTTITKETTIALLNPIFQRELLLGYDPPYIDTLIWDWHEFMNQTIFPEHTSWIYIYGILKSFTNDQILELMETTGLQRCSTWLQAISMIRDTIVSGNLDEKGAEILAYFSNSFKGRESVYYFQAIRMSRRISLFMGFYVPTVVQKAGVYICCKSETKNISLTL